MAKTIVRGAALALAFLMAGPAAAEMTLSEKVSRAAEVYEELLATPEQAVPKSLLEKCECVGVFPDVLKGAIGFGARFGQGLVSCRNQDGAWSPPAFFRMTGGSVGFQIGAESSDVVLFFMTARSARSLLESKFTLGGKISVAAGPAGRSAEASTDLLLDAEIYSYAKSKGLFAGASLEGARLAADRKANERYYGAPIDPEMLLFHHKAPRLGDEAKALIRHFPAPRGGR